MVYYNAVWKVEQKKGEGEIVWHEMNAELISRAPETTESETNIYGGNCSSPSKDELRMKQNHVLQQAELSKELQQWGDSTLSETIQILIRTMKMYSDLQQSVLESENHCSLRDLQYKCTPHGPGEVGRSDPLNLADNMHFLMHMHSRLHNRLLTAVVNQRGGISPQHLISTDLSSSISQSCPPETQMTFRPEKSIHKCPQCGKFLVSKRNLKYHMKLHTGDMDYKCYICNKGFTHKNKLVIHIKLHTGQKDFVCSVCSKAFVQKCDLLRHTKLHTGQKDFICGVCSKGFIQRSDLLKHSKLHTGQKDFVCTVCSKAFIQKSDLLRHNKTHWPDKCQI